MPLEVFTETDKLTKIRETLESEESDTFKVRRIERICQQWFIYGIDKESGGERKMPVVYDDELEAEEYVERNSSPDNFERYVIRES